MKDKKCIVLLSGGLDSTTTLYYAVKNGYKPICLIFDYGQRHKKEINSAIKIANLLGLKYFVVKISLPWKGSSLLDKKMRIPRYVRKRQIPSTYVPARNIIFLSIATSLAEVYKVQYIFYGANQVDFSGYPDCRKEFIKSFEKMINKGTKVGVKGGKVTVVAPLINMTKSEIVKLAVKLGVPLEYTWSCYRGGRKPCGICPTCKLRYKGFKEAGINDPLLV
ncbi:MAG: 7-cyano-7-deazaguanine synthase QueC [Endomicrobia bacterium]|nr:7-cyano-7-deazaguanine synthase QueC [Endomicrobiia bacterium]MCX7941022.1 7-cyano-7-deazaguanine synthase QueC [Endomicrobiia bacterium]MDW8055406.1 7-cyano-7-deazaguanine synthase QueC [Elusimicrobiota bacterium]